MELLGRLIFATCSPPLPQTCRPHDALRRSVCAMRLSYHSHVLMSHVQVLYCSVQIVVHSSTCLAAKRTV
jgi:hypothetical protein